MPEEKREPPEVLFLAKMQLRSALDSITRLESLLTEAAIAAEDAKDTVMMSRLNRMLTNSLRAGKTLDHVGEDLERTVEYLRQYEGGPL